MGIDFNKDFKEPLHFCGGFFVGEVAMELVKNMNTARIFVILKNV